MIENETLKMEVTSRNIWKFKMQDFCLEKKKQNVFKKLFSEIVF